VDKAPIVIEGVMPDSPAEKAGLKAGDTIVSVNKVAPKDRDDLVKTVGQHKPGDKLTVVIKRDGKEQTFVVTLAERPQE
jgi:S1-C subfamily serine protease